LDKAADIPSGERLTQAWSSL